MIFKDHKTNIQQILRLIPDNLLSELALGTKVNYCAKVLQGERVFYLLLYALLKTKDISQRYLEDVFSSSSFKFLFNYSIDLKVSHSSISERLSKINLDFFRQAYEAVFDRYNELYATDEQNKANLIRIDSSMVAEAGTRLQQGMNIGKKKTKKEERNRQQIKYTMAYDGEKICAAKIYSQPHYLSEDKAMPPVVKELIIKDNEHKNIYVFDRGLASLDNYNDINASEATFIGRIKTSRKKEVVSSLLNENTDKDLETLELISDDIIHLYNNKDKCFDTTPFRLVVAKRKIPKDTTRPQNKGKVKKVENVIHFITNDFEMSAKQVANNYKRRWDIEVFFKFIKQELNFKHFLSVNQNGLQVMLYMSLITAMLLMIYKKENGIGFKTAKRRFAIEIEDIVTMLTVLYCDGNIEKYGDVNYYRRLLPK